MAATRARMAGAEPDVPIVLGRQPDEPGGPDEEQEQQEAKASKPKKG